MKSREKESWNNSVLDELISSELDNKSVLKTCIV